MSHENRPMVGPDRRSVITLAMTLLVLWMAAAACAQSTNDAEPNAPREVGPVSRYPLEQAMPPDPALQTWLYLFSAVMLLCIGWLCFKPTKVEKSQSRKPILSRKMAEAAKKGGDKTKK